MRQLILLICILASNFLYAQNPIFQIFVATPELDFPKPVANNIKVISTSNCYPIVQMFSYKKEGFDAWMQSINAAIGGLYSEKQSIDIFEKNINDVLLIYHIETNWSYGKSDEVIEFSYKVITGKDSIDVYKIAENNFLKENPDFEESNIPIGLYFDSIMSIKNLVTSSFRFNTVNENETTIVDAIKKFIHNYILYNYVKPPEHSSKKPIKSSKSAGIGIRG